MIHSGKIVRSAARDFMNRWVVVEQDFIDMKRFGMVVFHWPESAEHCYYDWAPGVTPDLVWPALKVMRATEAKSKVVKYSDVTIHINGKPFEGVTGVVVESLKMIVKP